ncbi:MAG: amidohydrolase family protein, partial [Proteobacteria bacterium]|nr:amidohydrolase family protein [Pseudomonadota bacterium]
MDVEITATGKAELRQDDTGIFGERIKLNQEFNRIDADGGVRLEQGSDRFFGTRLRFDSANQSGTLDDPTFIIRGGDKPGRGKAERIDFRGRDHYSIWKGSFTTCEPGRDDWSVEGDEIELDYDTQVGTVRSGRLRFMDTTIAVSHLILDGVMARNLKLKVLVAHGGAYLAHYWARMDHAHRARADVRSVIKKPPSSYLAKMYFDTITFDPEMLANLVRKYGSDHVMLGTDYPYDMGEDD